MDTTVPAVTAAGGITTFVHRQTCRPVPQKYKLYTPKSANSRRRSTVSSSTVNASTSTTSLTDGVVNTTENGNEKAEIGGVVSKRKSDLEDKRLSLKDYFEQSEYLIRSDGGRGPPRWFSPLECAARLDNSPLLLSLPG